MTTLSSNARAEIDEKEELRIVERDHIDLSAGQWAVLSQDAGFWRLAAKDVIRVAQPRAGTFRVQAQGYVGRAIVANFILDIVEKVPGSVESLLTAATGRALRLERVPRQATETGPLLSVIVSEFLRELRAYVSRGREIRYERRRVTGSLISGKVDISRTITLRAKGLGHKAVFTRNHLSARTPFNRVLLGALREIERIGHIVSISAADSAVARGYADLFADNADVRLLFGRRGDQIAEAERLADEIASPMADLAVFALVLLSHSSFEPTSPIGSLVPRAWFINLERLFEQAVRRSASKNWTPLRVTKETRRLFVGGDGKQPGTPDLAIHDEAGCRGIGDAKYKLWDDAPDEEDLYELIGHAGAFRTQLAFLIYPAEAEDHRYLGENGEGLRTHLFAVDVRDLDAGMVSIAKELGWK